MVARGIGFLLAGLAMVSGCGPTVIVSRECHGGECACPNAVPAEGASCSDEGLECTYLPSTCTETWQCGSPPGQPPPQPGSTSAWHLVDRVCGDDPVPCEQARDLDRCATLGEICTSYFECSYQETYCAEDGRWHIGTYEDECCYDECCYGDCCDPSYCPDVVPEPNSYCDPCWDGGDCSIVYETECGLQATTYWCDPATAMWQVAEPPPCK